MTRITSGRVVPPPGSTPRSSLHRKLAEADPFASVNSSLLRAAARRVLASPRNELADAGAGAEVLNLLLLLTTGVASRAGDPSATIDRRARCGLGRRLLDLLRAEVVRTWSEHSSRHADALPILTAIEQVREAIEPEGTQYFTSQLSGPDGLEVLVEIAHDLRSPLTSILFLAELLQRGQSGPVTELQRRQLGLIYGAALGLSSVTSDIIELARGGDQLVEKEPVPFSITSMLESVRDIVSPIAEEKKIAVRLLPPQDDLRLGHPVALSRVLLNLTTNALKFTDEGYVEIETREHEAALVEFAVRDSGKGINPAVANALFQPLRRVPGRSGHIFSKTGLGLTICRSLVEAMGSELGVETRPGWGTRFFFAVELPTYRRPPAVQPAKMSTAGRR